MHFRKGVIALSDAVYEASGLILRGIVCVRSPTDFVTLLDIKPAALVRIPSSSHSIATRPRLFRVWRTCIGSLVYRL